jgi:hypothetical protein
MLTAERLRQVLTYSPETGDFVWAPSHRRAGKPAGTWRKDGYLQISIDNALYLGQRLALLYMTGEWPPGDVDHADVNPRNNRWENLRPATRSQNVANAPRRRDNTSGFKGVWLDKRSGLWVAEIVLGGRKKHLGRHSTPEAAHRRYAACAEQVFGEFARAA